MHKYLLVFLLALAPMMMPVGYAQDEPAAAAPAAAADDDFDDFDDFDAPAAEGGEVAEPQQQIADPLKGFNVVMYHVNDKLYFWVLQPIAKGWAFVMPEQVRLAINRFFKNLAAPIRIVNNVLQAKFERAGVELGRFVVNSTIGVLGLWDAADEIYGWEAYDEDLGQTFGHYGLGPGFYLVLPFLGPSSARDAVGTIGDSFVDPITYLGGGILTRAAVNGTKAVNSISLNPDQYPDLKKQALDDPYSLIRDVYSQNREKQVAE